MIAVRKLIISSVCGSKYPGRYGFQPTRVLISNLNQLMSKKNIYYFSKKKEEVSTVNKEYIKIDELNQINSDNEQQKQQNKSWWRFINNPLVTIMLGAIGGTASYLLFQKYQQKQQYQIVKPKSTQFGGHWSLIGANNTPFGSEQLQGNYYLIYFGFSNCPDVCPSSLTYLSELEQHFLNSSKDIPLKIVFVSVDPNRDSPSVLQEYLMRFSPRFIGVTADSEEDPRLKECMKSFKVYARKILPEDGSKNYNVDHSSLIFLMDKKSDFVTILNTSLPEKQAAQQLLQHIKKIEKLND